MNRHIQIRLKSVQHILSKVVLLDFVKSEKNIAEYGPRIIEGDGVKPIVEFTDSGNPTYLIENLFHERGSMWQKQVGLLILVWSIDPDMFISYM